MKGLLKTKSAGSQFLVLVGITLVSVFVVTLLCTLILMSVTGISLNELTEITKMDLTKPGAIRIIRWMQIIQFLSLFLVPVIICARLFSNRPKEYLGLVKPSNNGYYITGIAIMLLAIPVSFLVGELNKIIPFPENIEQWITKSEEEAAKTMAALLSKQTVMDLVLNIFCIAGLAAVGEELLFRGMAQRLLIKMFKSPFAGILISAILFSAMHLQFYGFLPRLVLGILLGYIYWYSGSLWTAILAHFIYDAFMILFIYFFPDKIDETSVKFNTPMIALISGCGLFLILTFIWMKRKSQTTFAGVYTDDAIPVKDHPF